MASAYIRRQVLPIILGGLGALLPSTPPSFSHASAAVCVVPPYPSFGLLRHTSGLCMVLRALIFLLSTCHLAMNSSASSRISRYDMSALFAAWTQSAISTPHCRGGSSVKPSGDRQRRGRLSDSQGSEPVCRWPTWSRVCSTGYPRKQHRTCTVIAPRFVIPVPHRRRAVVSGWSFRCSGISSS